MATLPLEPAVVKKGDMGDMHLLDNYSLPIIQEFNTMVDLIVHLCNGKIDSEVEKTVNELGMSGDNPKRVSNPKPLQGI